MTNLYENTIEGLKKAIAEKGSIRSVCDKLNLNPSTVSRWLSEEGRGPNFRIMATLLEHVNAAIYFPHDSKNDITVSEKKELLLLRETVKTLKKDKELLERDVQTLNNTIKNIASTATQNDEVAIGVEYPLEKAVGQK